MHVEAGLWIVGLTADDCAERSAGSKGCSVLQCCSCGGRAGQPARAATVAGTVPVLVVYSAFVHVGALRGMLEVCVCRACWRPGAITTSNAH